MSMHLSRRGLLKGASIAAGTTIAASAFSLERALAASMPEGWQLGFADLDADIPRQAMQRVLGRAPSGLVGDLYRNGPAKFRRPGGKVTHWFDGDGMIRHYRLDAEGAQIAARFVDTPKRRLEQGLDAMVVAGFGTERASGSAVANNDDASAANTHVIPVGDDLWALWEAGSPMKIAPETLATRGFHTLGEGYKHMPFLAHPKVEPDGRIWNLGQAGNRAIIWRLSANGALEAATPVTLPRASYIHDFTATEKHIVLLLQPWIYVRNAMPVINALEWQPDLGTQVLVLDKNDLTQQRIFELPAFSFFHVGDAWEESDGTIRFEACIEPDATFATRGAREVLEGRMTDSHLPMLTKFALHPHGRGELASAGITAEFPRSDHRRAGLPRRYTCHTALYRNGALARGLSVFDWQSGQSAVHDFGPDHIVEEFVFAAGGSGEMDGWLVGTTLNLTAKATELHVLRARDVAAGPVATWRAAHAVPLSFHGSFVAG